MTVKLGSQVIYNCKSLELPWRNNKPKVSCIPPGIYQVVKRNSPKYGDHFHIQDVPGRDYILIHQGNYHTDILGCILPGQAHTDINGDGLRDVTNSKNTLRMLLSLFPESFTLTIA
ncbi:hypothetical protein AHMF7605_10485 [Adhaeribacter arboris]|uniref:DUF5675 domain-containing protein n=2 Tax=Adhaeribacter arboris TaxID=2072846 RepID=A0A2T2YP15_9BACT|nr:hypothetical protein AHMF7605_10485 [Adhaeribacter arboris]